MTCRTQPPGVPFTVHDESTNLAEERDSSLREQRWRLHAAWRSLLRRWCALLSAERTAPCGELCGSSAHDGARRVGLLSSGYRRRQDRLGTTVADRQDRRPRRAPRRGDRSVAPSAAVALVSPSGFLALAASNDHSLSEPFNIASRRKTKKPSRGGLSCLEGVWH